LTNILGCVKVEEIKREENNMTQEQQETYVQWVVENASEEVLMTYMEDTLNTYYDLNPDMLEAEWKNDLEDLQAAGLA
jgi:hypothetical protein